MTLPWKSTIALVWYVSIRTFLKSGQGEMRKCSCMEVTQPGWIRRWRSMTCIWMQSLPSSGFLTRFDYNLIIYTVNNSYQTLRICPQGVTNLPFHGRPNSLWCTYSIFHRYPSQQPPQSSVISILGHVLHDPFSSFSACLRVLPFPQRLWLNRHSLRLSSQAWTLSQSEVGSFLIEVGGSSASKWSRWRSTSTGTLAAVGSQSISPHPSPGTEQIAIRSTSHISSPSSPCYSSIHRRILRPHMRPSRSTRASGTPPSTHSR